nr:MAG: putative 7.3 kDa protein [Plant associated tombus-like virus 1]
MEQRPVPCVPRSLTHHFHGKRQVSDLPQTNRDIAARVTMRLIQPCSWLSVLLTTAASPLRG